METQVKLPDLGEGVESAVVVSILVAVGDEVKVDQAIAELETDKAVAEVPSPEAGTVKEIHVEVGQNVQPGAPLLTLTQSEEKDKKKSATKQEPAPQKAKSSSESPPAKLQVKEEQKYKAIKDKPSTPKEPPASPVSKSSPTASADTAGVIVPAAPMVRRMARELGVDLHSLTGSGEEGMITEDDVKSVARQIAQRPAEPHIRADWGPIRREPLSMIRKTIAQAMYASHMNTAPVTHFDDADVTELEAFRQHHKDEFAMEGIHLTLLPFVVRSLVEALKLHPLLNASLDMDNEEIVHKEYISVGIAVDTDRGLVMPVLRNADCLSIAEIAHAIDQLVQKVKGSHFDTTDLRGGTFTISNLGVIGTHYATPILHPPESGVLLLGRMGPQPVVRDGNVTVRTTLPLSLTYDHRIVDGAEAARFLNDFIAILEDPNRLLTH